LVESKETTFSFEVTLSNESAESIGIYASPRIVLLSSELWNYRPSETFSRELKALIHNIFSGAEIDSAACAGDQSPGRLFGAMGWNSSLRGGGERLIQLPVTLQQLMTAEQTG